MVKATAAKLVLCRGGTRMTNYERVRNMSVEEMAAFIPDWSYSGACKCDEKIYVDCNQNCKECVKEWLESEWEQE